MALRVDTPLPTPLGWITAGEVEAGDYLYDELGYPTKVVSVSDRYGVPETARVAVGWGKKKYPEEDLWCSVDQKFYTISSLNMDELGKPRSVGLVKNGVPVDWPTWLMGAGGGYPLAKVWTPEGIRDNLKHLRTHGGTRKQYYYNHSIPIGFSLKNPDGEYDIHPYVLGVCLNYWDYDRGQLKITLEWFSYFRDNFAEYGFDLVLETPVGDKTPRATHVWCSVGGLPELLGEDRRIPVKYMRGSVQDRLYLLEGLMDIIFMQTVEHDRMRASTTYSHPDRDIAFDLMELVRSLGYPAYRVKRYDHKKRNHAPFIEWHPFDVPARHPKLKIRMLPGTYRRGNPMERQMWKVYASDIMEETSEVKDIMVDSPHGIYLAGGLMLPVVSDGI